MGRFALGLLAILVVVASVAVTRTLTLAAPAAPTPEGTPIAIDARSVAQHLGAAVRFQTISYGNGLHDAEKNAALDALRNWLAKTYPTFHKAAKREIVGKSLLFTWKGRNPKLAPILLMAHMDVVPVVPGTESAWQHGPFSGDVAGGYVWGRGSLDDKGSLVALLEAAERLSEKGFTPERTIMFAFGQDEEVGGLGGNKVMAALLAGRGVHFDFVLDEGGQISTEPFPGIERPVALVAVAEKGYLSLDLVAHGQGGHSSIPTHDLAIVRLAEAVLKVMNHPFASGLDDIERDKLAILAPYASFPERLLLGNLWLTAPVVERMMEMTPENAALLHTTIAPTIIAGGVKDNVIPPKAHATINFRLHPRDTIATTIAHVRKAIDDPKVDVAISGANKEDASNVVDTQSPAYRFLAEQIRASFNNVPVAPHMTMFATDSRHYQPIADAVLRLDPFTLSRDDLARMHGTNERLAISNLAPAVAFYMRLIENAK